MAVGQGHAGRCHCWRSLPDRQRDRGSKAHLYCWRQLPMEENNKDVQLIVFAHEGHGLSYTKNERRYFTELLEFLEKHIGH
jgi:hypothetical protein